MIGSVPVGGNAPITVQTMTNTLTSDAKATIDQIRRCEEAGADLIRVSCPDVESTAAMKEIVRAARVPIIADIHFHYKRALEAADAGAACLRINPGNIGSAERVNEVVNAAKANGCAIRIGVNAGSLCTTNADNTMIGYGTTCAATGGSNTIVGSSSLISTPVNLNCVLGASNSVGHSNCIVLGTNITTAAASRLYLGSVAQPLGVATGVGAAGGATALPATPVTYLIAYVNGTQYKIPLYNP